MKKLAMMMVLCAGILGCQAECPEVKCDCAAAPQTANAAAPKTAEANDQAAAKENTDVVKAEGETIALPPMQPVATPLTQTLQARKSTRQYGEGMISLQDLSNLLWSANGINREDGKRTAPSARNMQSVSIYVAFETGAYLYDFKAHQLNRVTETDIRTIKEAPLELVFVSNHNGPEGAEMTPQQAQDAALIRGIDAGTASQNAALYCAAADLGTVIRMYRNVTPETKTALQLKEQDHMLFFMPVGKMP